MNSTTLQALRRLLFFTQAEAAILIGCVSERSWIHWERGTRPVPGDVSKRIHDLLAWRMKALQGASETISHALSKVPLDADIGPTVLVWYTSVEDWMTLPGREPVLWHPQCSVIAELCATHNCITIPFDGPAYSRWLNETHQPDLEQTRGLWAASTLQEK